jgi:DNA-directed RNA polymerase subunit RpoE
MYLMAKREKVVRIPPDRLAEDLDATVVELAKESFEGKVEGSDSLTVLIRNIRREGPGRIVHGDGAVYQKVTFDSLIFRPMLQEVVEGQVVEVLKFGAFVRFGPMDGLLHISQIMDDRIDVDDVNQRLLGKDEAGGPGQVRMDGGGPQEEGREGEGGGRMKVMKACKHCSFITEEDTCPLCGNQTSKDWQGYVIILDHDKSEIAKRMGINVNGKFALRVR